MAEFEFRARNPESLEPTKKDKHLLDGSAPVSAQELQPDTAGRNFSPLPNELMLNKTEPGKTEAAKRSHTQFPPLVLSVESSVAGALTQTVGRHAGPLLEPAENPFANSGTLDMTPLVEADDSSATAADVLPFPARRPGPHMTGSQFFNNVLGIDVYGRTRDNGLMGIDREKAILEQVEAGNIPDFLRKPKKVLLGDGAGNTAELMVMSDYLAIGTNEDFIRVPVTPVLARAIADRYGLCLPTRKIVDEIYRQADLQLRAVGLVQSPVDFNFMQGNGYYAQHNRLIEKQIRSAGHGLLVAGHKKDIIVSRYAQANPDRLDFYGFFDMSGNAIQSAGSGAHDNTYVDYSHGIRLVSSTVIVNGRLMKYDDVLRNTKYARLLSSEGPMDVRGIYTRPVRAAYEALFAHN